MKTYYEILGIDKTADPKSIKLAYRKLVKAFHPDVVNAKKGQSQNAHKVFEEITVAYTTLSHPEKRKTYDEMLSSSTAKKDNSKPNRFFFREFKNWLFSLSFVKAIFSGRRISQSNTRLDNAILSLPVDELLKRIIYSQNRYVQINAVRAILAQKKTYAIHDLLRLLYSGICDEVKLEIIEGLKEHTEHQVKKVIREIYDIEKSFRVRQAIKRCL